MKRFFTLYTLTIAATFLGCTKDGSGPVTPQAGVGGSMARFAITDDVLYIVSPQSLEVYDLANPAAPKKTASARLGIGIETIYPHGKNLFIGANDGMYIYDNQNPLQPVLLSHYRHIQSCDPVVVQGKYAYVTLRGGTSCRTGNPVSTLDVVDISDLKNPKIAFSQAVTSPYGLGVYDNRLFVCDGDSGLKLFTLEDPRMPALVRTYADVPAYDVIVRNAGSLIVTGKKGLYQYGFSPDKKDLTELSVLPVQAN